MKISKISKEELQELEESKVKMLDEFNELTKDLNYFSVEYIYNVFNLSHVFKMQERNDKLDDIMSD